MISLQLENESIAKEQHQADNFENFVEKDADLHYDQTEVDFLTNKEYDFLTNVGDKILTDMDYDILEMSDEEKEAEVQIELNKEVDEEVDELANELRQLMVSELFV